MKFLTNQAAREEARRHLAALLESRREWLCSETGRRSAQARPRRVVTLSKDDWELSASGAALRFCWWTETGTRVWRVVGWRQAGGKLLLEVTRRAGAERAMLELVPRASVRDALAEVKAARLAVCEGLARLACALLPGAEIESVRLSAGTRRTEPGRYARVLLRQHVARERIAVTGAVVSVSPHEIDAVLASALAWWSRLNERERLGREMRAPATRLWLIVSHELSLPAAERAALLREEVRHKLSLFETSTPLQVSEDRKTLTQIAPAALDALLAAASRPRLTLPSKLSDTAARLVALAPGAIDVVRARYGETVRFRGLPFARVRCLAGAERVWFNVPGAGQKVLLDEENWPRLAHLLDELAAHRRANPPDPRHTLYRAAPENWLESILRRDITRLDPGLIVSPLHAQFRAARASAAAGARPVDLLALRREGRLVVIELKVAEDAALPFQGADYWRRISAHQRAGHLRRARLFGEAEISDEPPLVYLVAPLLRFHRRFEALARFIAPRIEMYRFDINEDWRAGVRTVRRTRVN